MRPSRDWMYNKLDDVGYIRDEYANGVQEFIDFVRKQECFRNAQVIRCPCMICKNKKHLNFDDVHYHLLKNGFRPNYNQWTCHGEPFVNEIAHGENVTCSSTMESNPYREMVMDAYRCNEEHAGEEQPNPEAQSFFNMLHDSEKPLYDGCTLSILSMAARLMNIKCEYNIPHRAIDALASLMKDMCPAGVDNNMTETYYKTRRLIKGLELPHKKIHVCPNGCMLFWKEDQHLSKCRKCLAERYKDPSKLIPNKVLTYFPIGPRLQRLYATTTTAQYMRWHAEHPREVGTMAHPSDGEAWKTLDKEYQEFEAEIRNIRLGLCTDGFAPFARFDTTYSCWPVILTPYNLPPWLCMKRPYMFLSLLIPGPSCPKGNIDVYLQPLIEELKSLWEVGVLTYDALKKQNFIMRAAVLWTISDFPAYGKLFGWSTATASKYACPYCMENTKAFRLENGGKCCWFDCHRQFLVENHVLRGNKSAFRKDVTDYSPPPPRLTGSELWECVKHLPKTTDLSSTIDMAGVIG